MRSGRPLNGEVTAHLQQRLRRVADVGRDFSVVPGEENHMYHSSTLTCNPRSIFLNRLPRRTLFCFAVAVLLLSASTGVRAQATSAPSAEQIQALQKKLDALQSQMAEVQGEIRKL